MRQHQVRLLRVRAAHQLEVESIAFDWGIF